MTLIVDTGEAYDWVVEKGPDDTVSYVSRPVAGLQLIFPFTVTPMVVLFFLVIALYQRIRDQDLKRKTTMTSYFSWKANPFNDIHISFMRSYISFMRSYYFHAIFESTMRKSTENEVIIPEYCKYKSLIFLGYIYYHESHHLKKKKQR